MWILFGTNRNDHWNRRERVIHAPQLQWLSVAFYLLTIRLLWVRMSGANLGMLVESGFVSHHWQPFIEDSWLTQQGMFTHKTQEALLCGVSGVMMLGKDCGKGYRERKIWWPASFQGPESVILLYWLVGEEGSPSNSSRLSLEDAWRGTVHNHSFMGGSVLFWRHLEILSWSSVGPQVMFLSFVTPERAGAMPTFCPPAMLLGPWKRSQLILWLGTLLWSSSFIRLWWEFGFSLSIADLEKWSF